MKQRWSQLAARIDAMSLRQRAAVFAGCASVVLYLVYTLALDPWQREYTRLHAQMTLQQALMTTVDTDIGVLVEAYARDPDTANRNRLDAVRQETRTLGDSLAAMQKGLVAPDQMAPLLQTILRANGKLQLVSLTTLPVTPVGGKAGPASAVSTISSTAAPATAPGVPAAPSGAALLYRHGVQVTVRGSYLDMVDYMAALESLPTQLFWGQAQFEVEEYPRAHITLTLYTLSLDPTWLKL